MCLDEEQVLLFIGGSLSEAERAEAESHIEVCAACRRLVAAAAQTGSREAGPSKDGVTRALARGDSVGRYLIIALLGRGGMGEVFSAYDPELDRRVALKLLRTARSEGSARERLVREARALGKLSHPNVVQVHDVGEYAGDVFLAMELVDGQSLDAWCRGPPKPSWEAVVAAYLDAARGLSAAHARGLVHRDVKPSNILRGKDGRVRVADFGLASQNKGGDEILSPREGGRASAAELEADGGGDTQRLGETAPAVGGLSGETLTATGVLVGTPLYMAPEQHEGLPAGPACDQYGLCTALYQGLYGAPPFEAMPGARRALLAAKKLGLPVTPPAGAPVPAWIYQAIARGLAPAPADRHPSIDALVTALSVDPGARRRSRWRRAGVGVAAAALLAAAVAGRVSTGAAKNPCDHPEEQLQGIWDDDVKARVRAAFLGTGRPYAEGTAARVLSALDDYATGWAAMRREVCVAFGREAPARDLSVRRDACLDRRRGQLQALAALLARKPDPEVLDKAISAAAALPPLAYCADTEALTARVAPPEDPALRAQVAALQIRADHLEALHAAGKWAEGVAFGEPLLAEVRAVPYAPLRARVAHWMGRFLDATSAYPQARALLEEAAVAAAEGRDDVLAESAWTELLFVVGEHQQRFEEVPAIRAAGRVAVARAHDELTTAAWANNEAVVLQSMDKYAEARPLYEQSVAVQEKILGPEHPHVITALNNLATLLRETGAYRESLAMNERVLALREKILGPDHPDVTLSLSNLASVLLATGDYAGARAADERALSLFEARLGPDHAYVATSLNNLAGVLYLMGDYPPALADYTRAMALREKDLGPDRPGVAYAMAGQGRALMRLGRLDEALSLLERSRAILEKALGATSPDVAEPLLYLGELCLVRHKPDEAERLLERALALHDEEFASEIQLTLADALWQVGKDRLRARALAAEVRATYERIGHRPGLDRVTRWQKEHPGKE